MYRVLKFLRSESGAVTVDWVVMTAAVAGLGLASTTAVRTGTNSLGSDINTSLTDASVASLGRLGDDNFTWAFRSNQSRWDGYLVQVAAMNTADVRNFVSIYHGFIQVGIDAGRPVTGAYYDVYAAAYLEMQNRGEAIDDTYPHPRDI